MRMPTVALKSAPLIYRVNMRLCSSATKRYFTKDHEWLSVTGSAGTIGITDHAQKALGDVVFVELPEIGTTVEQEDKTGAIESVKAVSDVYAPVSGKITEVNEELSNQPGLLNKSFDDKGWLFKLELSDVNQLKELMDEPAYKEFLENGDK